MQHTALKQIKYNRGQVTDKLSERSDMGLQNACGVVYDNVYINRYGQLQNAPCLEMAGVGDVLMMWYDETASDEKNKVYYPINVSYLTDSTSVLEIREPIIIRKYSPTIPVLDIPTGEDDIVEITDKSNKIILSYIINKPFVNGKTFQLGVNTVVYGQNTPPWLFYIISSGKQSFDETTKNFYAWRNIITGTTATAYTGGRYNVYLDGDSNIYFSTQTEGDTYLGRFFITTGTDYSNMQQMLDLGEGNTINLSISSGIVKVSAYVNGVESENVTPLDISDNFKRVIYTLSETPSQDENVYDTNFVLIGTISSVGGGTISFNGTTNQRYTTQDTQHDIIDYGLTVKIRDSYFDKSFNNIFVRGLNTQTPTGFTPPASGHYYVYDDAGITTKKIITIKRNGAGGAFVQGLVGQIINCPQLSGAVQVREIIDSDTLKAYVLSPLITANDGTTQIDINWGSGQSEWVFGYEKAFSSTNGWPDSAASVNQRLFFGGNDKYGNLLCASRIGVINDFDPSDGTESDAFSASISAPESCRIVDFVQSNDELRIATTYGEYAVSLSALTPTGIIQSGFQLRSQVGVKEGTPICDCGGLTAYVSNDGNAIHCTQFNLLQNKYAPISLTSQTEGVVNNCIDMVYLRNRDNDEGNLVVGLTSVGNVFGLSIDTNAGLNAAYAIYKQGLVNTSSEFGGRIEGKITKLFALENILFAQFVIQNTVLADIPIRKSYIVKLSMNRIFDLSYGYNSDSQSIEVPIYIADLAFPKTDQGETSGKYMALYKDGEEYSLVRPTGYVCEDPTADNAVATLTFADGIDQSKILTVGFVRQSDWRSVELSLGLVTREANKRIVKLSSVVEPIKFYGDGDYIRERYTIPETDTYKFLSLVVGKNTPKLTEEQIDNPTKVIYTEGEDMSWRRGFDNPSRELYYGLTFLAPFLIKSTTAVLEYDDVS